MPTDWALTLRIEYSCAIINHRSILKDFKSCDYVASPILFLGKRDLPAVIHEIGYVSLPRDRKTPTPETTNISAGKKRGTLTFYAPGAGSYEVRAYYDYNTVGYRVAARTGFKVVNR